MATELLCYTLDDDETIFDALKQAIEEHDRPELVAVRPFNVGQDFGMWVSDELVSITEISKAKNEGRCYEGGEGYQWVWSRDGRVDR